MSIKSLTFICSGFRVSGAWNTFYMSSFFHFFTTSLYNVDWTIVCHKNLCMNVVMCITINSFDFTPCTMLTIWNESVVFKLTFNRTRSYFTFLWNYSQIIDNDFCRLLENLRLLINAVYWLAETRTPSNTWFTWDKTKIY